MSEPAPGELRRILLEELGRADNAQADRLIRVSLERLGKQGRGWEQKALSVWSDLFRSGLIGFGIDLSNMGGVFFHKTDLADQVLSQLSNDPYNPTGYLAGVSPLIAASDVATSYIEEGVAALNAGLFRAAAVLVGVATEALLLEFRDLLLENGFDNRSLKDRNIKTVTEAIGAELASKKKLMVKPMDERVETLWPAIGCVRLLRNASGHPGALSGVTADMVHASYLYFVEISKLLRDVSQWVVAQSREMPS